MAELIWCPFCVEYHNLEFREAYLIGIDTYMCAKTGKKFKYESREQYAEHHTEKV